MFRLYILFCCVSFAFVSEGKTVLGIRGRSVSLSWTFNNKNKDAVIISHDSSPLLLVWPHTSLISPYQRQERLQVYVDNSAYETVTVTVMISNIRENDAGIYKLQLQGDSEDFNVNVNDSVILQTVDEAKLPWITMVRHVIFDSSIELQCNSSIKFTGRVIWKVNESMIECCGRYSQDKTLLSIRNLTTYDRYNLYTCKEFGSEFESDPYRLNISGPDGVTFESNVTIAKEHEGLNLPCHADCKPIFTWNWTKVELLSAHEKAISAGNILQIRNITRNDAGKYSCKVHNIITGISHESFTYLDILYGPDEINFNISGNLIYVNEFENIYLNCYADCFPPCQFRWSETHANTLTTSSALQIDSVNSDINRTCHATNPMNANASISSTIHIKVRSGTRYNTTTLMITGKHIEGVPVRLSTTMAVTAGKYTEATGVSYFTTTTMNAGKYTETNGFLSVRNLMYIVLGMGIILAVGLVSGLLHKFRTCLCVGTLSKNASFAPSNNDRGNEEPQGEHQSGKYWTIVSNARGEMTTAIEIDNEQYYIQTPHGLNDIYQQDNLEDSTRVDVAIEHDEYLETTHSGSSQHDDYIHPFFSGHVETDIVLRCDTTAV